MKAPLVQQSTSSKLKPNNDVFYDVFSTWLHTTLKCWVVLNPDKDWRTKFRRNRNSSGIFGGRSILGLLSKQPTLYSHLSPLLIQDYSMQGLQHKNAGWKFHLLIFGQNLQSLGGLKILDHLVHFLDLWNMDSMRSRFSTEEEFQPDSASILKLPSWDVFIEQYLDFNHITQPSPEKWRS